VNIMKKECPKPFKNVKPDSAYNPKELKKGLEIEKEHTSNITIRKCITKHHLNEFPDYYTRFKGI